MQALTQYHRLFCLVLNVCLALGLAVFPSTAGRMARADPPPPGEVQVVASERLASRPTQVETPPLPLEGKEAAPPPARRALTPAEQEAARLEADLAAFERALQAGPQAVVALKDRLHGRALDLVMADIVKAQRQLARSTPPRPATQAISPAEEEALMQAQTALDAASRARALASAGNPAENRSGRPAATGAPRATTHNPDRPAADLTVGSLPCAYATIAAAITAAGSGDRLLLEGGAIFTETLNVNKNLTLQGGYNGCGSGSTARTTLDGGGVGTVVVINAGLAVTLTDLNLTNGDYNSEGGGIRLGYTMGGGLLTLSRVDIYDNIAKWGGGIWVGPGAQVVGTEVDIHNNTATEHGGGVRLFGSHAAFSSSGIYGNHAPRGGGVYGTLESITPTLDLPSYVDVHDNEALTGSGLGGGVYMSQGFITVTNCSDIGFNDAVEGGGVYLVTSTLTIQGGCSSIQANTATGNGGGVYAQSSTVNMDWDAALYDNTAGSSGTGSGGGAYLDASTLMGDKVQIALNTADDFGGGVYATHHSMFDMDLGIYPCSGPRCSQLSDNTATGLYGGGAYAADSSEIDLAQTFVENNVANYGGGLYAYQSPVYLYNDLLADNDATGGVGDGLRLYTGSSLAGSHNTWAYNNAAGADTGNAIGLDGASLSLSNSIVWGHATSIDNAAQTVVCSDIEGGYAGTGNMDIDPLFIDATAANFHLQSLSPVMDRCAIGQARDFDNELRPVVYARPATPYDIGADEASKRVGINGLDCAYGRIQDAIDAAAPGDVIQAAAAVFSETVTISGTNLTIAGGYDVDCATPITSVTTVNGSGHAGDSVFNVTASTLTLRDLVITSGDSGVGGGIVLIGSSQVTLNHTDVSGNQASYGGGIYIGASSTLTATNDSDISNNTADLQGGGVRVWGTFVGDNWLSAITGNSALNGGGASVAENGRLALYGGSHIMNNYATSAEGRGGGLYVNSGGIVTLTDSVNIGNNSAYDGAGLYADNANVYISSATLQRNVATHHGGGVYLANASSLAATGVHIGWEMSGWGNQALSGGGLYVDASRLNLRGRIVNNMASGYGGGLYATGSVLNLSNTQVGGTDANEANQLSNSGMGAGLYLSGTHASLANTVVASNTFPATSTVSYGGGLCVSHGSVVTLTDSSVERHLSPSTLEGRGAGLYISDGRVTLDHSQVLSNTASTTGGGLRLYGASTLNILNDSELRNNRTLSGEGGALAATGAPDINISDSTLQDNAAGSDGGAIYLDAGALNFTGQWNITSHTAGGNGGALAVAGAATANLQASGGQSSLSNNTAGGNGGALHVSNASDLPLRATDGYALVFAGNTAGGNGGGAYANSGALFNTRGQVIMTANRAAGNGGVFYLSGGSRLWLNDHSSGKPQLRVNWAQNGGAVFAQNSPYVRCNGAEFGHDPNGNHTTAGSGGALYLSGSIITATNCIFHNSAATADGGAIAAYTSTLTIGVQYPSVLPKQHAAERGTQALLATFCNPLEEICSSFYSNIADSDGNSNGNGGAIYTNDSALSLDYSYLHRNSAVRGGAIFQDGAAATAWVSNSLVYSNTSTTPFGAGIRRQDGDFSVMHTTLVNNIGGSGFSGVASAAYNTIAWGNTGTGFSAAPVITSCNIDDGARAGPALDPEFVSPGAGEDYHLQGSSPAIDRCDTGLSPDLDNVIRHVGCGYDAGAYEYASTDPLTVTRAVGPGEHTFGGTGVRINFTDIGSLTEVTVTMAYTYPTWQGIPRPLPRRFDISGDATDFTADLTLCYADNEWHDEGIAENDLRLYRYVGDPTWTQYTSATLDTTLNRITAATTEFSTWAIGATGHEPTLVSLVHLRETGTAAPVATLLTSALLTGASAWVIKRRR